MDAKSRLLELDLATADAKLCQAEVQLGQLEIVTAQAGEALALIRARALAMGFDLSDVALARAFVRRTHSRYRGSLETFGAWTSTRATGHRKQGIDTSTRIEATDNGQEKRIGRLASEARARAKTLSKQTNERT